MQNNKTATELDNPKNSRAINRKDQRKAALGFLHLHDAAKHIERLYYYSYRQPSERARTQRAKPHLFDSGLIEAENEAGVHFQHETEAKLDESHGQARPAYCVLVYKASDCGPTAETGPSITAIGGAVDNGPSEDICEGSVVHITLEATINPNGSNTNYYFELGESPTSTRYAGNGSEQVVVSPRAQVASGSAQGRITAGNCPATSFRVVASNENGTTVGRYSGLGFITVIG